MTHHTTLSKKRQNQDLFHKRQTRQFRNFQKSSNCYSRRHLNPTHSQSSVLVSSHRHVLSQQEQEQTDYTSKE